MERQWVCYDLHFFWQILNKHLGKALDFSWKILAASLRGATRSRAVSAAATAAASGNCSSLRVPARLSTDRAGTASIPPAAPAGSRDGGCGHSCPSSCLTLNPKCGFGGGWWPGGDVVAAVGDQQSPALLLLPESHRFLPRSSLGALLGTSQCLP